MGLEWVATVVTGAVGAAGIGAALWGGSRERSAQITRLRLEADAEERRALITEKRRVYAGYLTSVTEVIEAIDKYTAHSDAAGDEDRRALEFRLTETAAGMVSTMQK